MQTCIIAAKSRGTFGSVAEPFTLKLIQCTKLSISHRTSFEARRFVQLEPCVSRFIYNNIRKILFSILILF